MTIKAVNTRFRAYQLDTAGGSFSYFADGKFALIEARLTEASEYSVRQEMALCGVDHVSTLHITSWDQDHCSPDQLEQILADLRPSKIEYPGYDPHTDSGKESKSIIKNYKARIVKTAKIVSVTPDYINGLEEAKQYGYKNILYHPRYIDNECANNNSTVKHFRTGSFNVLSLGDVESQNLAAGLRRCRTINSETDVMILAHHGAANGFTTNSFIKHVRPRVAIATSNYANQFNHPKPEIRELLHKNGVRLFTTKTGDVLVQSINHHTGEYQVINLKAGSAEVSSSCKFMARKREVLSQNLDSIRNRIHRSRRGPGR